MLDAMFANELKTVLEDTNSLTEDSFKVFDGFCDELDDFFRSESGKKLISELDHDKAHEITERIWESYRNSTITGVELTHLVNRMEKKDYTEFNHIMHSIERREEKGESISDLLAKLPVM